MSSWTWRVMPAVVGLMAAGCPPTQPGAEIPECTEDTLAPQSPLDMTNVFAVGPMGAVDPLRGPIRPGPSLSLFIRPQDPRLPSGDPARVPVVAPARLWIQRVRHITTMNGGRPAEFSIDARSCRQVTWTLEHLTSLSPELASFVDDAQAGILTCVSSTDPDSSRCEASVPNMEVAPGTELGLAGNWSSKALGVRVRDLRAPPVIFASSEQVQWTCPLDAFQPSVADALRALPSAPDGRRRTAPPLCGEYMQDVTGTAAGNWVNGEANLALIHDNVDPGIGVISTNPLFNQGDVWRFFPTVSGTVNRDFRQLTGDGTLYCYDASTGGDVPGIVLIQLPGDGTLLYERQPVAECGAGPWALTENAKIFAR